MTERLWTLTELATELGITPDSLRQRIARGTLPAHKMGRDWFVTDRVAQVAIVGKRRPVTDTETAAR